MDDLDFIEALSPRREFESFVTGKTKTALSESATITEFVRSHPLALPVGGAVLAGAANIASNIRDKKTGKTKAMQYFEQKHRHITADAEAARREGRKLSFKERAELISSKPLAELADLAAEYPVQSTLASAAYGASVGYGVAKMVPK